MKGVEERNLRRVETSRSGGNDHITLSDHSYLGIGFDSVGLNNRLQFESRSIREDEPDLVFAVVDQSLQFA